MWIARELKLGHETVQRLLAQHQVNRLEHVLASLPYRVEAVLTDNASREMSSRSARLSATRDRPP